MYITVYKDFVFIEGIHPSAKTLNRVSVSIKGAFTDAQLKTLTNVKDKLIQKAFGTSANSIMDFKYGQKSTFLGSLMNRDDVFWFGEGILAVLPTDIYNHYLATKK